MFNNNIKPDFKSKRLDSSSSRILKDQLLPSIRNKPVSPELHGDHDYDDFNPDEQAKPIITSAITQDDIEFYEELERKQQKSWKRRKEQDLEFMKEALLLKASTIDITRETTNDKRTIKQNSRNSLFEDSTNKKNSYINQ